MIYINASFASNNDTYTQLKGIERFLNENKLIHCILLWLL